MSIVKSAKVTRSDKVVVVDVDQTLVLWHQVAIQMGIKEMFFMEHAIKINGQSDIDVNVLPHHKNIEFVRMLKAQGNYIIVWSAGGFAWAEAVVDALNIHDIVDEIKSKPCLIVDDNDASHWLSHRSWLHPVKEPELDFSPHKKESK